MDTIDMLMQARQEINVLREANRHMAPKAEAYDALLVVIQAMPRRGQGMQIDVVPELTRHIDVLIKAQKKAEANKAVE